MSLPSSLSTLVAQPSQSSVFVARLHSTALHAASRNGFLEVVKALVEAGADVKVATGFGKHALDLATKQGHTALVEFLRPLYPEEAAAQLKKKQQEDAMAKAIAQAVAEAAKEVAEEEAAGGPQMPAMFDFGAEAQADAS